MLQREEKRILVAYDASLTSQPKFEYTEIDSLNRLKLNPASYIKSDFLPLFLIQPTSPYNSKLRKMVVLRLDEKTH